jgi:hypothetical protein
MPSPPSLFDDGSKPNTPATTENYVQPNIFHGLRIWWAYYWPTTIVAFIADFWMLVAVKVIYENTDAPGWLLRYPRVYGVYVVQIILDFFGVYYVLHRSFRGFRIALLPKGYEGAATPLKVTLKRTVIVWWTFAWRRVLYTLVVFVVVMLPAGVFLGMFNPSPAAGKVFVTLLGVVTGAAISLFIIYASILDEDFSDFKVGLLPRTAAAQPSIPPQPEIAQPLP